MRVIIWNTTQRQWQRATEIDHAARTVEFTGTLDVTEATPFTKEDVQHFKINQRQDCLMMVNAGLTKPNEN